MRCGNGSNIELFQYESPDQQNAIPKNTNLGAISGTDFHAGQGAGALFNGRVVANSDVVVKYTYNGDTDLNGKIDFDDYSRTDNGFNNNRTGWFNGDFDYNGVVDFDDYSLIDQAFNTQGTVVLTTTDGGLAGPGERTIIEVDLSEFSPAERAIAARMQRVDGVAPMDFNGGTSGTGAGLSAVPEPSALIALAIGLPLAGLRRRRP